jgi:hypothetical protein
MKRLIPLGLAALVAVISAAAALALSGEQRTAAPSTATQMHMNMSPAANPRAIALRIDMRALWEDHVSWTRMAVISLINNSPDTKATVARLLQNQAQIGAAIKPYYGAAASKQLASLLRQHILIAADIVAAAKKGDKAGVAHQEAIWHANADQISKFLNSANPKFWKLGALRGMMYEHLGLTTNEVVEYLQHHYAADVHVYDEINAQALQMADMLTSGIVAQFPSRFGQS